MKNVINKLICRLFGHAHPVYRPRITNVIQGKQIRIDRFRVAEEYRCPRCGKVLSQSFYGDMNRKEMQELCKRFPDLRDIRSKSSDPRI